MFSILILAAGCGPKKSDSATAKEEEDRARLRQIYSQVVGTYEGTVTPFSGARRPVDVQIQISLVDVPDGVNENREVIFRPELQGSFVHLEYINISPVARRPLLLRYYPDTTAISMANTDKPTSPVPNQGKVNVSGTLRGDVIDGDIVYVIGDEVNGRLHVERVR